MICIEVLFKMGAFSDTQHTHPGIFILELPPPPKPEINCTPPRRLIYPER